MLPAHLESAVARLLYTVKLVAVATLLFGVFSAAAPRRSIALYQWIMAQVNWRVSPIDERREVGNTRLLGVLLAGFSLAALWLVRASRH